LRKYVRWIVGVFVIGFAIFVSRQLKERTPPAAPPAIPRTDPGAMVESTKGNVLRVNSSKESFTVYYDRQLTYEDGSMKLFGLRIVAPERGSGGRTFEVNAKEGHVGAKESNFTLDGNVELKASDGLMAKTEHATYAESDGIVRTPGPASFTRGRVSGDGTGMTYDKTHDVLWLNADAHVRIGADAKGAGGADVRSGLAGFARKEKYVKFEQSVKVERPGQTIEADNAVGFLTEDEDHIQAVELRGHSRIRTAKPAVGALESLTGRDMNLKYSADGQTLEHATITGQAEIRVAGEAGKPGRQITAPVIDIALAPDGSTPVALTARDGVVLTFPPDGDVPGRVITSATLDAKGEPDKGLTRAMFAGGVDFRERGPKLDRHATSATLDVGLKPGLSTIESARFRQKVKFVDGDMTGLSATAVYDTDKGTLALSGSDPGAEAPHVDNPRVSVDGVTIDVTLSGPRVQAAGTPVKSVLQPPKEEDGKMPTMLKKDQPVTVLANTLDYDSVASKSVYKGGAKLFQGDTSIKADEIVLDDKNGDLTAVGAPVTTTTMLEQTDPNGNRKKDRVRSIGTSKDFTYEDASRRLTYTGDAHMNGPQGDMNAAKIELYLKPSGDELERAEAYEKLKLREQNRTTTGARLTYTTADEKYLITGLPVEISDQCGRKTTGKTLTFTKATDTIVVDGSDQIRTQTKGGGKCQ
jgi:lipopolysaccharide transport protein LptA